MYPTPYVHDNYAGGLEDVIVHSLLFCALAGASQTNLTFVDTHGAAGRYSFRRLTLRRRSTVGAASNKVARVTARNFRLASYLRLLRQLSFNAKNLFVYPSSSVIARRVLPKSVPMILAELNECVASRLSNEWRACRGVKVFNSDGFALAKELCLAADPDHSFFVHVDPAYESARDYERILDLVLPLAGHPNVTFAITYPASSLADIAKIEQLFVRLRLHKVDFAFADFRYQKPRLELRGAGLLLIRGNPRFAREGSAVLYELRACLGLTIGQIRARSTCPSQ
jgi:23S rRNA (adenine2030-N6)-methyltransferase